MKWKERKAGEDREVDEEEEGGQTRETFALCTPSVRHFYTCYTIIIIIFTQLASMFALACLCLFLFSFVIRQ